MTKKAAARLGGLASAKKMSPEKREIRASKAGITTRALYGSDFFRHIRSLRKS